MNKTILGFFVAIFLLGFAFATTNSFAEGEQLVKDKIDCGQLNDEQLEKIGDYYMEQMHPGEAHELMDQMMGGEGSESLKQVHINMAKSLYCGDKTAGYGVMGTGMMSGGMMNMMGNSLGYGMMGGGLGYSSGWSAFFSIFWILIMLGILLVIILVIIKLIKAM